MHARIPPNTPVGPMVGDAGGPASFGGGFLIVIFTSSFGGGLFILIVTLTSSSSSVVPCLNAESVRARHLSASVLARCELPR